MSHNPFLIGICGGSGSGKTTLAHELVRTLGAESTSLILFDWYYNTPATLSPAQREKLNFDHPDILDYQLFREHLVALKSGKAIQAPEYDFSTHQRTTKTNPVDARKYIIADGILLFHNVEIRELFDLRIFVDTPVQIRYERRLARDIAERGRTAQSVEEQWLTSVQPMHQQFCEPCKRYATLIVQGTQALGYNVGLVQSALSTLHAL